MWVECSSAHTKGLALPPQDSRCSQVAYYGLNEYISETRFQPVVWVENPSEPQTKNKSE